MPKYSEYRDDTDEIECGRCGSSMGWDDCWQCGGDGTVYDWDDTGTEYLVRCSECDGKKGWNICLSSAEWCEVHPLPGNENIFRSTVKAIRGVKP